MLDENDKLLAGVLPDDPADGCEPYRFGGVASDTDTGTSPGPGAEALDGLRMLVAFIQGAASTQIAKMMVAELLAHEPSMVRLAELYMKKQEQVDGLLAPAAVSGRGMKGAIAQLQASLKRRAKALRIERRSIDPDDPVINGYRLTDLGNARRMLDQRGEDLRFCVGDGKWYVWDRHRWRRDDLGEINQIAKCVAASIQGDADRFLEEHGPRLFGDDEKVHQAMLSHAKRAENTAPLRDFLTRAATEPGVGVRMTDFDPDPWVLGVENGVVDLRTGQLRPARRSEMVSKQVLAPYNPRARAPTWERFLDQVMDGDREMVRFLQRALGYTITGRATEQVLFILYGEGSNGKGTMIETVRELLGDYARSTPATMLMEQRFEGIPNDVARLVGARMVTASETDKNKRLAEGKVKQLTGGDTLAARFMHKEYFEFKPQFSLWLLTNNKPVIRGTDYAIWRRLRLVPFNIIFKDEDKDPDLPDKLRAERPGILRWLVEGCLEWQRQGLNEPEQVKAATREYQTESDQVGRFLDDRCELDPVARCPSAVVYAEYKRWCEKNGEYSGTKRSLSNRLGELGFKPFRTKTLRGFQGLRVIMDTPPMSERW
ncbi:MAG: phage/plasmid primase, P4 family [Myxococcota bacterium]